MRSAVLFFALVLSISAQRPFSGALETKQALDKLNVVGSALMIAAHPDDENTGVIAYLARGKKVRTAYLSLNRGEGGQNLIGSEQGVEIGVIRTQELLAARRIDGGEQFFSQAGGLRHIGGEVQSDVRSVADRTYQVIGDTLA